MREDHLRNHQKLIDAALELFDTQGLDVALREIGECAGVSQAGVFRHFSNRDQLIIEVYDQAAAALSDRVTDALTRARDAPAEHRLDLLLTTIVDAVIEHPSYGQLSARGVRLYPDRQTDPALLRELASLIADAQDAGLLASDITGFELVNASVLVAGMMTPGSASTIMGRRVMTVFRRGLTPHAQALVPMPALPSAPDPISDT